VLGAMSPWQRRSSPRPYRFLNCPGEMVGFTCWISGMIFFFCWLIKKRKNVLLIVHNHSPHVCSNSFPCDFRTNLNRASTSVL
jgi:hypothetical protein